MFRVNLHRGLAGYPREFLGGSRSFSWHSALSSATFSSPVAAHWEGAWPLSRPWGSAACVCFGMDKLWPSMSTFSLLSADLRPSYLPTISLTFWPGKNSWVGHPTNCSSFSQSGVKFHLSHAVLYFSRPTQKTCVWHLTRMLERGRWKQIKTFLLGVQEKTTSRAVTLDTMGERVEDPV